ncbi:MAG: hypothetical protein MJ099_01240 [Clostridia bacterium]|nr:hypothetical protein [Clostridia bacterium]
MSNALETLRTVLPVMLMLVIGMICRSKAILTRDGIDQLKKVVVNITLPAVLIGSFATTKYTLRDVVIPLMVFAICLIAWALGKVAGKVLRINSRFLPFLTTGFEAGMLGYALFAMLCGSENTASFAIIDLGQVLFVFTVYKILVAMSGNTKADAGALIKDMLTSPIIIAIVAGVLIGATGLYGLMEKAGIAAVFTACTDFIAAPTGAVILLTIGYDLVLKDIPWLPTCKAVAVRFVIMMILRTALIALIQLLFHDTSLTMAINVMFILPPPFVLPVFADDPDQRVYVSSVLSVSTLVAIAGFAVLAVIG